MKIINYLPIAVLAISITACKEESKPKTNDMLYGNWNCQESSEDENLKLSMDYDVNFVRNGTSNAFGILKLKLPETPELEYSYADSSKWEVIDGYLITMSTEVKIINVSHPGIDDVFNLGELFPQNISDSSKILKLNETELSLQGESDGEIYTCSKVVNNS